MADPLLLLLIPLAWLAYLLMLSWLAEHDSHK